MAGAVLTLGAVLLSGTGRWFAPGDSLAVLRPHLGLALIGLAAGLWHIRSRPLALACGLAGLVALGHMATLFRPAAPAPNTAHTLYQKNLQFKSWPRAPLADEIIASGADIVTLQEVSDHNLRYMTRLFEAYPDPLICPFAAVGGVAILTRFEPIPGTAQCRDRDGLALIQVRLPGGRALWLASLHLHWPWPYGQAAQLEQILPRLEALDGPVIIAGDFNMVPWGAGVARIAAASDTRRAGPAHITFDRFSPALPLAIDHVLLPRGARGTLLRRPRNSSDHHGLMLRFGL